MPTRYFDSPAPADQEERPPPIAVPHAELAPETLRAVIESFVLREGTEYGERDVPLETKVQQVMRQLERGDATIYFDPATESVAITPRNSRPP